MGKKSFKKKGGGRFRRQSNSAFIQLSSQIFSECGPSIPSQGIHTLPSIMPKLQS
jgi:hypothetical protein